MKKATYKLLTLIPVYGTILKFSRKGEVMLCSPLLAELSDEGIDVGDIFKLLENQYPGEVVTNERFFEGCQKIRASMSKKEH